MTTPQSILHELRYEFNRVLKTLHGDEKDQGIANRVQQIECQNDDIINSLQRLENTMNLIAKLLQAYEKPN